MTTIFVKMMRGVLSACFVLLFLSGSAQSKDSVIKNDQVVVVDSLPEHSPKKAMILSAVLPGAGQVYNKKVWKVPIIYAGFATFGYFIYLNNTDYRRFRTAYSLKSDSDPTNDLPEYRFVSADALKQRRDQVRKWRDLTYILTGAFYALNIIDASVDAHLFYFRYQDFNVNVRPSFQMHSLGKATPGLNLSIRF